MVWTHNGVVGLVQSTPRTGLVTRSISTAQEPNYGCCKHADAYRYPDADQSTERDRQKR